MRLLLFFFLVCTVTVSSIAQYSKKARENYASRYGIKVAGGAIDARPEVTYAGNEKDQIVHEIRLSDSKPEFSFGLWGQKRFGWLYAEGNLMYSTYGMIFDVTTFTTEGQPLKKMTERFGYVDIQIMGGLISNGFRISVGPVMHILANHSSELDDLKNYNQKLRSVSYGFSGAIGYTIDRFSFDLRYDKAFRTIGDHIYYGVKKSPFLETPDAIMFSVAYAILE
jgi:hypothetical protein